MEEKELTKAQSAIIKSIQRCIRRFERIDKKLQQPWRKSSVATKEIHEKIKHLDDLLPEVGKTPNVYVRLQVYALNTIALLMETELKAQNKQKSFGEEITRFGQAELGKR